MLQYRPEIDGLRTIAVFAVIIFHLNPSYLTGGYYGVDVFFVISGFLITSHLTNTIKNKNFNIFKFWLKRVKRLLPTLLFVVILTILLTSLLVFKFDVPNITQQAIPAIFSYFNIYALFNFGDYWGHTADSSYFLHTWSLSLEEQFYIVYPLLLFIAFKYFKSFLIPIIILATISFLYFLFFLEDHRDTVFYLLPFRFWELATGGIIAISGNKKLNIKNQNIIPIIGIILLIICFNFADEKLNLWVLTAVFGTALLIKYCNTSGVIGKVLSSNIFTHFGKLSYSMYLWHWPLIVLYKSLSYQLSSINIFIIYVLIVLLTYILSLFTYNFIENKTRNYTYTPHIVLGSAIFVLGLTFYFNSSIYKIGYQTDFNKQTYYLRYFDCSPTQIKPKQNSPLTYNVIIPPRLEKYKNAYKEGGIITRINNNNPSILLIGDSHGVMWAKTIQEVSNELKLSSSIITTNASQPFVNIKDITSQKDNDYFTKTQRIEFAKMIVESIEKWNLKYVFIASRWENLNDNKSNFEDLVKLLLSKKIKIILLNQPPVLEPLPDRNAIQYLAYLDLKPKNGYNILNFKSTNNNRHNQYLNELTQKYSNISVLDIYNQLKTPTGVRISYDKDVLYFDDDHLSYMGTQIFKNRIKELIIRN